MQLKTLLYCSKGKNKKGECKHGFEAPTINQQTFPNKGNWFWSGSPIAGYSDYAWYVGFNYGVSFAGSRDDGHAVRLVHSGQ